MIQGDKLFRCEARRAAKERDGVLTEKRAASEEVWGALYTPPAWPGGRVPTARWFPAL